MYIIYIVVYMYMHIPIPFQLLLSESVHKASTSSYVFPPLGEIQVLENSVTKINLDI